MTRDELKRRYPNASESFIRANLDADDSGAVAKLEPDSSNATLDAEKVQRPIGERFFVRVTSRRKRLLDEDNLCEKYHVDLCRYAKMLPDDAPDKLKIEVAQIKCAKGEPEETVIEIYQLK